MTKDNVSRKPSWRFLAPAYLAFVVAFFLAPVIPVDVTYACFPGGPPWFHYTDWQSASYYLFNLGIHYTSPHTLCQ